MFFVEVAVNAPVARRTFSYSSSLELRPGHAVWIPFGSRRLQGIVWELTDVPAVDETRDVLGLVSPEPILFPHQVALARWLAGRYACAAFAAAAPMLPPGFERRLLTFYTPAAGVGPPGSSNTAAVGVLTPFQQEALRLVGREGRAEARLLEKALGKKRADVVLGQLVRKGLLSKVQELERVKVGPRLVPYLSAARGEPQVPRLPKRQGELLELLGEGALSLAAVKEHGFSASVVAALKEKGLAVQETRPAIRDPLASLRSESAEAALALTPAQEAAWLALEAALEGRTTERVFLLHGVTGSGKTELYLRALDRAVRAGKRALVLVPEIALTPQTIGRFAARFPGRVAVLHSRLSLGEQFDEWWRVREGQFDVVVGSRGAIFAPQPDLGLIVVDEEHEWTYKQEEQAPHYHAREVALKLAELTGAVVVLGSATPALESYYRAERGEFRLLQLSERVPQAGGVLPRVEIVDMRRELREGNRSIFSRALTRAMAQALEAGEQAILFLNRRGSTTFVQCRDCGLVLRCRRCTVSLTYHADEDRLVCHLCNQRTPPPRFCPTCFGRRIRFLGAGTQKVEEEAARLFPSARLLRWDRDVTQARGSHEEILKRFLAHEADILIGTQMVAKGLHLPLVTLVGVVLADVGLHLPDFRSGERTFQLLTQVAGRAGRGSAGGKVLIQTYSPDHYAIAAAASQDYGAFYQKETAFRRELGAPPFSRLARLVYSHANSERCRKEVERVCKLLRDTAGEKGLSMVVLGPSPAFPERLRGRYRWQAVLRGPDPAGLMEDVPLPQGWVVDIDPASLT